jgi:hypothetical protein
VRVIVNVDNKHTPEPHLTVKENVMSTVNDYFPSPWLNAANIGPVGAEMVVHIVREVGEDLKDPKTGDSQTKPTLTLAEFDKSLILNKTNFNQIAMLHGQNSEAWGGKAITLYVTQVDAFGETHDAIRVRDSVPSIPAEPQYVAAELPA